MKDQRKRVAKRLASGLLAGALALGGLAISGGPASAKTPVSLSTNRISGADRYETAVAVARKMGAPSGGLVIASGATPYDALAGSVLTNNNRPLLLVQPNSIPTSVADYISDFKTTLADGTGRVVYVVGGTSAISADVFTAISKAVTSATDLTPPTVVRLSGADRYATAKAISEVAGVTAATDTLIIANGENDKWADSLSAGPLSAWKGWPIVTTTGAALDASAKSVIDSYIAMPGSSKQFLILGGAASISPAIEEYLTISKGVAVSNVRRIGGLDRYMTNVVFNLYLAGLSGTPDLFTGEKVALVNGESPWDSLSAAGWAGANGVHVVMTPSAGGNTYVNTLISALAGIAHGDLTNNTATGIGAAAGPLAAASGSLYGQFDNTGGTGVASVSNLAQVALGGTNQVDEVWLVGGSSVVPNTTRDGYVAKANADLTATLSCGVGDEFAVLSLSSKLTPYEALAFTDAKNVGNFLVNNVAAGVDAIIDAGVLLNPVSGTDYLIELAAAPTTLTTIKFAGWAERSTDISVNNGAGADFKARRSISSASCTPAADSTAPTVTAFRAISGSAVVSASNATTAATHSLIINFSEPVKVGNINPGDADSTTVVDFLSNTVKPVTVGATGVTRPVTISAINGSLTRYEIKFSNGDAVHAVFPASATAATTVTLNPELFTDLAGNPLAAAPTAAVAADSTAPTVTVSAVECMDETATQAAADTIIEWGSLKVAPSASIYKAARGFGWSLVVVNQRGLVSPKMTVDAAAKRLTVTADVGYHTPADLETVLANSLQSDAAFGTLVGGGWKVYYPTGGAASTVKLSETVAPVSATSANLGKSYCQITLSGSEPISVGSGLTIAVGGLSAGYVTATSTPSGNGATGAWPYNGTDTQSTKFRWTHQVKFTTNVLGAGTVVAADLKFGATSGIVDLSGNNTTAPISFTIS